jgi:hypothetical protein
MNESLPGAAVDAGRGRRDDGAMRKLDSAWYAFLAMGFAVVGGTGLFATFAAPVPLERALLREQALDEAAAALAGTDPLAALAALRPRLGESADALLPPRGDMAALIRAERTAMRARFQREAAETEQRLRWLMSIVTLVAAGFGLALLGLAAGQKRRNPADVTSNTRER